MHTLRAMIKDGLIEFTKKDSFTFVEGEKYEVLITFLDSENFSSWFKDYDLLKAYKVAFRIKSQLTLLEIELLKLAKEGLENKEISTRLNIAEGTVRNHFNKIYDKLDLERRNIRSAIYIAEKGGLLD